MAYNGKHYDLWINIQKEINNNRIVPISFKKTLEERVELSNAKRLHKKFIKDNPNHKTII